MAQIVVVEDDVYMREELIDVLKKAGYDAVPLLNFENAVSQIMALSPDLISAVRKHPRINAHIYP